MHKLQEVIRLHRLNRSGRQIARQLRMGRATVQRYLAAFARAGVLPGSPDELPELRELVNRYVPAARVL